MCVFNESEETSDPTEPVSKSTLPSRTGSTLAGKNEDSGDAVTISLAAVGCLLLLGVVLVVFCLRRRSARTSDVKKKGIAMKCQYTV